LQETCLKIVSGGTTSGGGGGGGRFFLLLTTTAITIPGIAIAKTKIIIIQTHHGITIQG